MREVFDAIGAYAEAYGRLEQLQNTADRVLPRGDQKTGVIAEFFASLFIKETYPDAQFSYGSTSEYAWDILVRRPGLGERRIQVKAVSCHSTTSRVSPIHPGWDELYLMRLDERFLPEAFWIIKASEVSWAGKILQHKTMPRRGVENSGSPELRKGVDHLHGLLRVMKAANPPS